MSRQFPAGISEEDLSAYVDDRLDPERRAAIDAALRSDPELARTVAELRSQDEQLRAMAAGVLHEPVPERLLAVIRRGPPPRRRLPVRELGQIAAALVIGIGLGWFLRPGADGGQQELLEPFLRQAVLSHQLFEANEQLETLRAGGGPPLLQEVRNPFRTPIRIPELIGTDLRPVLFRSLEGGVGPGIQLAYLGDQGHLTSLLIRQHSNADELPVQHRELEGRSLLYWLDGPLVYVLVGDGDEEELRRMALSIYASTATGGAPQPDEALSPVTTR